MQEAGVCARIFPICGDIDVILFDDDDNVSKESDVHFVEKLFANNEKSFEEFFDFVGRLDTDPECLSMNIKITSEHVVLFYKTPNARVFRRDSSLLDPLDYAD